MRHYALLLGCLLVLNRPLAGWAADAIPSGKQFAAATFNIYYQNLNLTSIVAVIRSAKADVVALQETNPQSAQFLRRALGRDYPHQEFRAGDRLSNGLGLLSRTPIRQTRYLPPKHGAYGTLVGEVTLAGQAAQVVVVHLQSPRLQQVDGPMAALKVFATMEDIHAREIAHIHSQITTNQPTLFLGDFNSLGGGNALRFLTDRGWIDSAAAVSSRPETNVTWSAHTLGRDWRFRIDYLFHPPVITTLESRVIPTSASDHFLLVSRLGWRELAK